MRVPYFSRIDSGRVGLLYRKLLRKDTAGGLYAGKVDAGGHLRYVVIEGFRTVQGGGVQNTTVHIQYLHLLKIAARSAERYRFFFLSVRKGSCR